MSLMRAALKVWHQADGLLLCDLTYEKLTDTSAYSFFPFELLFTDGNEERKEKIRKRDVEKVLAPLTERGWREPRGVQMAQMPLLH